MNKNEVAYVIEVNDDITKVKMGRHSDCKNCGACPGNNNIIMGVNNPIDAKVGDKVCIEIKENKIIQSVYVVYIQPLLFIFLGALLGYFISRYVHGSPTFYEVIFGGILFIISLIYIKISDKKAERNLNNIPTIIKIL